MNLKVIWDLQIESKVYVMSASEAISDQHDNLRGVLFGKFTDQVMLGHGGCLQEKLADGMQAWVCLMLLSCRFRSQTLQGGWHQGPSASVGGFVNQLANPS